MSQGLERSRTGIALALRRADGTVGQRTTKVGHESDLGAESRPLVSLLVNLGGRWSDCRHDRRVQRIIHDDG